MDAILSTVLHDAIHTVEHNWDAILDGIENGHLPDVPDLREY